MEEGPGPCALWRVTHVWGWAHKVQAQASTDSIISQGEDTDYALFSLSHTHTL